MSYLDDLRECRYTAPSGASFALQFDDLSRSTEPKAALLDPPQQSRTEVQNLGFSGVRFPMSFYLSGPEYHTVADDLFDALMEPTDTRRPGTLQHPRWGDVLVAVVSGPSQVEGFVENMGQAVFTVEFITVDREAKFPDSSADAGGIVQAGADDCAAASEANYGANGVPENPAETARVGQNTTNFLTQTGDALRGLASSAQDLGAQFSADLNTALSTVDDLVADPLALASSILALVRAPAQAVLEINAKIESYKTIANGMVSLTVNSFAECELLFLGMGAVAVASCEASLSGLDFGNRGDAVDASDNIDAILAQLRALLEAAETTGWVCDGDTWAGIEDLMSTCRSRLLNASFDLKAERRKALPSAMDPHSAVKALYGTWSDELVDQFGLDNDLADDEWFMIPAGRMVVWYA